MTPGGGPTKLAGTEADFHPSAVSVGYKIDGSPSLTAVNRRHDGSVAVEVYHVVYDATGDRLAPQAAVQGQLAKRASGSAALGNGRFYLASNPTLSDFMAWADHWFLLSRADVLFFNGQ